MIKATGPPDYLVHCRIQLYMRSAATDGYRCILLHQHPIQRKPFSRQGQAEKLDSKIILQLVNAF
jgi:hypothetical protein